MDGRWKFVVAGGILFSGLVGCTTTAKKFDGTGNPPPPPPPSGKNQIFVPEPPDDPEKKTGPLSSTTLNLIASMRVDAVAKDPNCAAAQRDTNLKVAREIYQGVLAQDPRNIDALLGLGQLYVVSGELDKLHEIEQRATTLHPNNPKVWEWVAIRQAQVKNWEGAATSYSRAVKLDPENRKNRINLGFTLARNGQYTEGYEWLSRSMREAEARYNLAMMMIHNGEKDKASIELRLALRADPNFEAAGVTLAGIQKAGPESGSDIQTAGYQDNR